MYMTDLVSFFIEVDISGVESDLVSLFFNGFAVKDSLFLFQLELCKILSRECGQ